MNRIIKCILIVLIFLCCNSVFAIDYTYDTLSRLTTVVYDNGRQTTYAYDNAGNRISCIDSLGAPVATPTPGPYVAKVRTGKIYSYPNPFRMGNVPTVTFRFDPNLEDVSIEIYDISNMKIVKLTNIDIAAGIATWDGKNTQGQTVTSNIYWVVLSSKSIHTTNKFTVLR